MSSQTRLYPSPQEIKAELVKRYAQEKNILAWGKLLFPDKFNLSFCKELHNYFIDIRKEEFTNTLAPRGHAKTTIKCFLIPIFQALNEPDTFRHYLNVQNSISKAISINIGIKTEIENNELLREIYGDMVGTEKWTEKQFVLANGVIFSGIGTGESVRGINYKSIRPDYLIIDDFYDEDDINSPDRVDKKERWFWSTLYPARSKSSNSSIHLQGTAISRYDLMHKLQGNNDVKSTIFRAIRDNGKPLWKEVNTLDSLSKDKEKMGSIVFNREMMNECRDDSTSIIKESWIQYYTEIPHTEKKILKICGVDPSVGQKLINDYTGIASIVVTRDKENDVIKWYIDEVIEEHLTQNIRIKTIDNFHKRKNFDRVVVEGIAGFKDFVGELRRTSNVPLKEIDYVKDKISNLEANSSKFENGKVFINENMDEKKRNRLVEQLINNFPRNDDIRDAVLLCLNDTENLIIDYDGIVYGDDRESAYMPY